jgi:general secretion pathway protein M
LPTGLPGRAIAVGITLLILVLLWLLIAAPLIDLYQSRADFLADRARVVARMQALAAALPELQNLAAQAALAGPPPVFTIEGTSDAVAAANLQNRVQDMASSAGANLATVEIVQATAVGQYRRIGLKLSFNAAWPVLVGMMRAIEQSNPPMLIDDLELHATPATISTPDHALDASLTVYAFRSGQAEASP